MLSYWVGRSLVERNADRYAREADLRFSLVRINEHIDAIALTSGEADEARHIETDIAGVLQALRRLVKGLTNLTWITAGYGWFTLVAPILVAAPLYFAGTLTFGGLMMASGPSYRSSPRCAGSWTTSAPSPIGARRCCGWRVSGAPC